MKSKPSTWHRILKQAEEENHMARPDADLTLRVAATFADILLFCVGVSLLLKLSSVFWVRTGSDANASWWELGLRASLIGLFSLGYFSLSTSRFGGTIGKRLLGIRVTTLSGKNVGFWGATAREILVKYLFGFLSAGIVPMLYLSGNNPRPLHDDWLGTRVKRVRGR